MKRRKLVVGGGVAGAIVGLATAASKAWTAAAAELWRADEELGEDDDIPAERRPFLDKLTGGAAAVDAGTAEVTPAP